MQITVLLLLLSAFWSVRANATDSAYTLTQRFNNHWPVRSWHELVTQDVVMQEFDYSCGAAAVATILGKFYNEPVTERIVLDTLDKTTTATFADLATVLPKFGFKGVGFSVDYQQLAKLKVPVIVAVRFDADNDHFSVLRGIDTDTAWLADPSTGNMLLPLDRFLRAWESRNDPAHRGKILIVLPNQPGDHMVQDSYFGAPVLADPLDSVFGGPWQPSISIFTSRK